MCNFGQSIVFIAKFGQYWKNKKNGGWAKTRAIVSSPFIWNPTLWSPCRNEIKWRPTPGFLPMSRPFWFFFKPETLWTWQILRPVVSRRNISPLKYVPTRRNEWNFYGLSTIKRRRTFETKKILWNAPRWGELFIGVFLLSNTPCDHEIRVPGC